MFHFRTVQKRNFWFIYLESFFGTFTGIPAAFASAFAIRLGASNTEISLMSSIPPLLVILVSIPFGRILQKSPRKLVWALGGLSFYRIGFLLLALAPWMRFSFITPPIFYLFIFVLLSIPIQFFNIGNVGMMIDIVPDDFRAAVFTNRNIIGSLVNIGGVFLAGLWLSQHAFPGNYQSLFVTTSLVALVSTYCWMSIRYPHKELKAEDTAANKTQKHSLLSLGKEMSLVYRGQTMFSRFTINSIILNIGLWTIGPLYALYTIRQLAASDAWIGLSGTISSICGLVGLLAGRRLIEWWGNAATHRRLVIILGIYPILIGLSHSLTMIIVISAIYSLLTPGYNLSNYNIWLKVVPEDHREDAAAIFNAIMSIGPFIFPLVGVSLSGIFGIAPTMVGCGILAMFGSISFWIWKIQFQPAAQTPHPAVEPII